MYLPFPSLASSASPSDVSSIFSVLVNGLSQPCHSTHLPSTGCSTPHVAQGSSASGCQQQQQQQQQQQRGHIDLTAAAQLFPSLSTSVSSSHKAFYTSLTAAIEQPPPPTRRSPLVRGMLRMPLSRMSGVSTAATADHAAGHASHSAAAGGPVVASLLSTTWLAPSSNWGVTAEQMARYNATTQGPGPSSDVLASHKRSKLELTRHDLQTLKPNEWLNDQCINMYMALLQDRDAALRGAGGLCCCYFSTFFLNNLYKDAKAYNYENVRGWTAPDKLDRAGLCVDCVLKCDRIIIPVHEGNHWTTLMVDVGAQQVVFFDSMAGENRRAVSEVKKWVADEAKDKLNVEWDTSSWTEVYPRDIPRQSNGVDCGVFALMFCNRLGLRNGGFDFRQADISVHIRAAITHDLLDGLILHTGLRS